MAKTKKEKSIEQMLDEALVKENEWPYRIPDNWLWTYPTSISNQIRGVTYKKKDASDIQEDNMHLILRGGNIQNGAFMIDQDCIYVASKFVSETQKLAIGDVVIVTSSGSKLVVGKAAQIKDPINKTSFGAFLTLLRPNIEVNPEYFGWFFQTKEYRDTISNFAQGININNIKREHFESLYFPLPPIEEQKRIVKKLSSMLAKLKEARELIIEAKDSFENRRAAILNKAFTGELTKKWRYENSITDIPSLKTSLETIPYKIPDQWKWVFLKEVSDKIQYGTSAKSEIEGEVPVLRMGNIQHGKIDWNDLKFTSDKKEIEKYNLNFNDVLFNRTNSPELVGKTAIYKGEMPAIFAGYLIKIKPQKHLNPDYLNYFLGSPHAKQKCLNVKTDGVNQSNINAKKLGNFELPIPHKKEQQEIVKILNEIFVKEITTDELIDLEEHFDLLEKNILSKAFRGELDTNDPKDEPVMKLLEKALQSRKLTPIKPKTRKLKATIPAEIKTSDISLSILKLSENARILLKEIKQYFGENHFNAEKLKDKSELYYEDFKEALFELLESKLNMTFNDNKEVITYLLKK